MNTIKGENLPRGERAPFIQASELENLTKATRTPCFRTNDK
jgi:hypothetical protein